MIKYADHLSAVLPTPFRVLGVPLRPLCLGHTLILSRLESPFSTGLPASDADLLMAVMVCSQSFESGREWIADGRRMAADLEQLGRALRGGWLRRRKLDWPEAEGMFAEYLADGYRKADVWQYDSDGPGRTAPWAEIVSITLTRAGWTESEIMNCYLPRLWIRYYTALEMQMFERARDPKDIKKVFVTPEERARILKASDGEKG